MENMECESENEGNHMPEVRGPRNRVPEAWHGIVSDESYKKYKEVRAVALLALRGQSEHQPVPAEGAEVSPSGVDAALEEMVAEGVAEAAARDAFLREKNSNEPTEWQSLMPSWAKALLEGVGGGVPFEPQRAQTTSCLADEMDALRERIDSSLRQPSLALRKVAHCAVLLYKAPFESSRSDIMVAKLFSLLAGEEYRAHNGQLFAYANGEWARTSSITYKTAEDIVQTLMLTEVCFMLLNNVDPERCEASLLVELKIVLDCFPPETLQDILLKAPVKKREGGWPILVTFSCNCLRKIFGEKLSSVLEKFEKWGGKPAPVTGSTGVNFQDGFLAISDTQVSQGTWSPSNNCYWTAGCRLAMAPDYEALKKLSRFLSTTFVDADDGFKMLMAYISLAARSAVMPHVILFIIGPGGEGKTLFVMKLLKAVFGDGHAECSASMLQQENEFRKQGYRFVMKAWMGFDEMKPNSTLEEEIFKLFVAGGFVDLRRNHEMETNSAQWNRSGKSWNGNEKDTPFVPSAREKTFTRRFRCLRLHGSYTMDSSKVDVAARVFEADTDLDEWLCQPLAGHLFWQFFLIPFIGKHRIHECKKLIMMPAQKVLEDTEWLQKRMLRLPEPEPIAMPDGAVRQTSGAAAGDIGRVAMDTFIVAFNTKRVQLLWREQEIEKLKVASNTGVRSNRTDIPTRVSVFDASVAHAPHLWRKVQSGRYAGKPVVKYQRRNFDWERLQGVLKGLVEERTIADIFGSWEMWGNAWPPADGDVCVEDVEETELDAPEEPETQEHTLLVEEVASRGKGPPLAPFSTKAPMLFFFVFFNKQTEQTQAYFCSAPF